MLQSLDAQEEVDAVFINAILSAIQQRNLEVTPPHKTSSFSLFVFLQFKLIVVSLSLILQRIWGKPVLDRVGLIIEIFNAHAHTKEAKLQVLVTIKILLFTY